jgi:uncharacterized protein YjiS (DUF1127 family)
MLVMNAQIADSQFCFHLPSMSYIDAKWEEPNLRAPAVAPRVVRNSGLTPWLSRRVAAVAAWRRDFEIAAELFTMSDRELQDIGVSREEVGGMFAPTTVNQHLRQRGLHG